MKIQKTTLYNIIAICLLLQSCSQINKEVGRGIGSLGELVGGVGTLVARPIKELVDLPQKTHGDDLYIYHNGTIQRIPIDYQDEFSMSVSFTGIHGNKVRKHSVTVEQRKKTGSALEDEQTTALLTNCPQTVDCQTRELDPYIPKSSCYTNINVTKITTWLDIQGYNGHYTMCTPLTIDSETHVIDILFPQHKFALLVPTEQYSGGLLQFKQDFLRAHSYEYAVIWPHQIEQVLTKEENYWLQQLQRHVNITQ